MIPTPTAWSAPEGTLRHRRGQAGGVFEGRRRSAKQQQQHQHQRSQRVRNEFSRSWNTFCPGLPACLPVVCCGRFLRHSAATVVAIQRLTNDVPRTRTGCERAPPTCWTLVPLGSQCELPYPGSVVGNSGLSNINIPVSVRPDEIGEPTGSGMGN